MHTLVPMSDTHLRRSAIPGNTENAACLLTTGAREVLGAALSHSGGQRSYLVGCWLQIH